MSRLFLATVLLVVPATLGAQETFTPLAAGLKPGEKVRILVDAPCATAACPSRLVTGRIAELTATSLVLNDGRDRRELPAGEVRYVERPKDRIWNGVVAGFAVGFGAGFVTAIADGCDSNYGCLFDGPGFAAAVGLFFGGIGAGVGGITDALISRPRVVFVRPVTPGRAAIITPVVRVYGGGLGVSVRF